MVWPMASKAKMKEWKLNGINIDNKEINLILLVY